MVVVSFAVKQQLRRLTLTGSRVFCDAEAVWRLALNGSRVVCSEAAVAETDANR